jgi:hypothetical protein
MFSIVPRNSIALKIHLFIFTSRNWVKRWKISARIIDIPESVCKVQVGTFLLYKVVRDYFAKKHNHTRSDQVD